MKHIYSKENTIWIAPFFIILYVFFIPLSSSLKSIAAVLGIIAVVLTPYYRKQLPVVFNTLWARAALLLFTYIVVASLWSDAPYSMRLSMIEKYSKLIYLPIFTLGFINPKTRKLAFIGYFAIMLVTCLFSLLKQQGLIALNNVVDSGEVFHNHIATGFMVALAVYFAAVLSFNKHISPWLRAYYALMIVCGTYQIFFLNTGRTGYVVYGLLMSLLIMQKCSFKKAIIGFMLLFSSIGVIYMLSPVMQVRTSSLISDIKFLQQHEENTSLGFRVQFHDYARSLFNQHPLIGMGTGSFKYRFSQDQPIPSWDKKLNDPHSQYWLVLAEQGLIGITLLFIFIGTLFLTAFQLDRDTRPIILGILIAFCFGSITDSILCYSTIGSLLIVFSALSFAESTAQKFKESPNEVMPNGTHEFGI